MGCAWARVSDGLVFVEPRVAVVTARWSEVSESEILREPRRGMPEMIPEEKGAERFGVGQGERFDEGVGTRLEEEGDREALLSR